MFQAVDDTVQTVLDLTAQQDDGEFTDEAGALAWLERHTTGA